MLYTTIYLKPGCPARHFERNQLTPVLISLSPLAQDHPSDLHINTGSGPPRLFRDASPCHGLDQLVPDLMAMTPGAFTPRPSLTYASCGHVAFAAAPLVYELSLAITINSPPRFSKRMPQPWSSPFVLLPHESFLQGDSTLSGCGGL